MNAQVFYQKAAALQAKGPLAVFSGDLKVVMSEANAAARAAADARRAEAALLPDRQRKMESKKFMQRLSAIPAAERAQITIDEAMVRILEPKYPC